MANRLWAEVYTPDGSKLGIVNLSAFSITHRLDAAGEINLQAATTDPNTEWLSLWREVRLYWEHPQRGATVAGHGILLQKSAVTPETTGWDGLNLLEELRRANTLQGLIYDDIPVSVAIRDLLQRASGWSAAIDAGLPNTSRRFDGQTVLQALLTLTQGVGVHLRWHGDRRIDVGAFGSDSGVRLTNLPVPAVEVWFNSRVAIIDPPQVTYSGYDIANWMVPLWGNGDAVLSLQHTTRTTPYTVHSTTANGRTIYYICADDSIAEYGEIQRVLCMPDAPYAGSSDKIINCANVLYDWAAAQLQRQKQPQTTYRVTGLKLDREVSPGDRVRLVYRGLVTRASGYPDYWLDIDEDVWVLAITRNYGADGLRFDLEISTLDYQSPDAVSLLADTVMDTQIAGIQPRLTSTLNRTAGTAAVSPGSPGEMTFAIADATVYLGYSTLKVTRASSSGPDTLDIKLDGEYIGGGPWLWGSSAGNTITLPIDDLLLDQTDWHGDHTVEISCQQNSGDLDVVVEVTEIGSTD